MADYSGSIQAANVAQTAAPAHGSRGTLIFQNTSDTAMWLSMGGTAVADTGLYVAPGRDIVLSRGDFNGMTNKVSVVCGVINKKYTCSDDSVS